MSDPDPHHLLELLAEAPLRPGDVIDALLESRSDWVTELLARLSSGASQLDSRTAEVLGRSRDPRARAVIADALTSPSDEIRQNGAFAAGYFGDDALVGPLMGLLQHRQAGVRRPPRPPWGI
jgi:HEAT repeat protein